MGQTVAVTDCTLIDPRDGVATAHSSIVITGDRITARGPAASTRIPAGARIVRASGKFVIPGLWDMHVHVGEIEDDWFPLYLANGLTGPAGNGSLGKERTAAAPIPTGCRQRPAGRPGTILDPVTDPRHSEMRMLSSADQYRYVLEQPVAASGGQVWNYNSGGTLLLEAVIAKAAGGPLDDVAREFLLEPLGITDVAWTKNAKSGIFEVGGLRLRSRDLAKIGQLVLNGGNWNGRRSFPEIGNPLHGSPYRSCRALHISTVINGGSDVLCWPRDARCRGFVPWDLADSASSPCPRSILWR